MNLPDFILLEILTYIERSKLRQLLGLNRRFKALIEEVALTTTVLDKPIIEALRGSSRKRDCVVYATLVTDQVYELKELFKNIKELTIEPSVIPRLSLFKIVSSYHSLRALDLFYCEADPIIAFAIAQSRNLATLRAPNFNLSKPHLLKFLSFLNLPYLNSLSIIVGRLDKEVLGMINKACPKLEILELLSSSASLDISEGLDCIWIKLKTLKISLADKFPETHAAVLFPHNFPQISSLFFSFPYKIAFSDYHSELCQFKHESINFKAQHLFLYENLQAIDHLTSFAMDCQNVSPRLVKAILVSSIRIRSLKLHRVNAPDLFKIAGTETYLLVRFSFSSALSLGASVVTWLSKCAPLLQYLSINCKIGKKFSFKSQPRLPLLYNLSTGNVVPFILLKFLVACSPNLISLSVWNTKAEPEWVLISKLFPFPITTSRDSKIDDGFALGIIGGPRPLTFQPLDRIIETKKRKKYISLPQLLYCQPLLDLNYDDI